MDVTFKIAASLENADENRRIVLSRRSGAVGYNGDGLPALKTNLDDPVAVSLDPLGTLYLVDDQTLRVRRVH